jgi:hypothetical protein
MFDARMVTPKNSLEGVAQETNAPIFVPDYTIIFNASFEPCLKYCLGLIGDRGMNKEEWTSWRLRREVIYLEKGPRR